MFLKALRLHVVTLTANVRFKLKVIKMENEEIKTLQNNSYGENWRENNIFW